MVGDKGSGRKPNDYVSSAQLVGLLSHFPIDKIIPRRSNRINDPVGFTEAEADKIPGNVRTGLYRDIQEILRCHGLPGYELEAA